MNIYLNWRDFRLDDNPALSAAIKNSKANNITLFVGFINDTSKFEGHYKTHNRNIDCILSKIIEEYSKYFGVYNFIDSDLDTFLAQLPEGNYSLFLNESIDPKWQTFYKGIKAKYKNIKLKLFNDALSVDRLTQTGAGNLYSVFTPFKNKVYSDFINTAPTPKANLTGINYANLKIQNSYSKLRQEQIFSKLTSRFPWQVEVDQRLLDLSKLKSQFDKSNWYYNEVKCESIFENYLKKIKDYDKARDLLSEQGTSRMSLGLAFGLTSSRLLIKQINNTPAVITNGAQVYISELIWREFYKYILYHYPKALDLEFNKKYKNADLWVDKKLAWKRFEKWCKGETGYQIVDAAMRQLNQTGWMHNRARMIVSSFLTKNLGVDWRWGQEYFRAVLIDLDEGSNNGGWQWSSSVGADPKPIRIFNPYIQQSKFDNDNRYVASWLGDNKYDEIIDYKKSRVDALARYKSILKA